VSELSDDPEASCQETVLDLYRSQKVAEPRDRLMSKLLSEVKLQPILSHLHAALASPASNETISEDLFDMIGYDDMDMIVEILDKRSHIAAELEIALKRPQDPTAAIDGHSVPDRGANLTQTAAKRRIEETLRHNAERPLFEGPSSVS